MCLKWHLLHETILILMYASYILVEFKHHTNNHKPFFSPYTMPALTYLKYYEESERFQCLSCCVIWSHILRNLQNTIYGSCGI